MTGGRRPPAWLTERHGEIWDIRAFQVERGVVAWRHVRLPAEQAGVRMVTASTWAGLSRRLDEAARFDAECAARRESCRRRREQLAAMGTGLVSA